MNKPTICKETPTENFAKTPRSLSTLPIRHREVLVLWWLYEQPLGFQVFPKRIAEEVGLSVWEVRQSLKGLEEKSYLTSRENIGYQKTYTVIYPVPPKNKDPLGLSRPELMTYTAVPNEILYAPQLSPLQKRLLLWMFEQKEDWIIRMKDIRFNRFKVGHNQLKKAFRGLLKLGIISRKMDSKSTNKHRKFVYELHNIAIKNLLNIDGEKQPLTTPVIKKGRYPLVKKGHLSTFTTNVVNIRLNITNTQLGDSDESPEIPPEINTSSLEKVGGINKVNLVPKEKRKIQKRKKKNTKKKNGKLNPPVLELTVSAEDIKKLSESLKNKSQVGTIQVTACELLNQDSEEPHLQENPLMHHKSTKPPINKPSLSVSQVLQGSKKPPTWKEIIEMPCETPKEVARVFAKAMRYENPKLPILNLSAKERGQIKSLLNLSGSDNLAFKIALVVWDWWRFKEIAKKEEGAKLTGGYPTIGAILKYRHSMNVLYADVGDDFMDTLGDDTPKPDKIASGGTQELSEHDLNAMMAKKYNDNQDN